jgi:hypothetical protein
MIVNRRRTLDYWATASIADLVADEIFLPMRDVAVHVTLEVSDRPSSHSAAFRFDSGHAVRWNSIQVDGRNKTRADGALSISTAFHGTLPFGGH